MNAHHAIDGVSLFSEKLGIDPKFVGDVDALDDEDVAFFLDLTDSVGFEIAFTCRYAARLKGAAERSGHSTAGGGNDVIQSRGVRFGDVGADSVMLRDLRVNTELHLAIDR